MRACNRLPSGPPGTSAHVTSAITGFTAGDQILMAGVTAAAWNGPSGVLTLTGGGKMVDALHLGGAYAGDVFQVTQSGALGVATVHSS